jgi:hypothetical protein
MLDIAGEYHPGLRWQFLGQRLDSRKRDSD